MNTVVIVVVVIVVVVLAFFALRGYSSKKPQVPQVDDRLNTDRRLPADDTKRPRRSRVIPKSEVYKRDRQGVRNTSGLTDSKRTTLNTRGLVQSEVRNSTVAIKSQESMVDNSDPGPEKASVFEATSHQDINILFGNERRQLVQNEIEAFEKLRKGEKQSVFSLREKSVYAYNKDPVVSIKDNTGQTINQPAINPKLGVQYGPHVFLLDERQKEDYTFFLEYTERPFLALISESAQKCLGCFQVLSDGSRAMEAAPGVFLPVVHSENDGKKPLDSLFKTRNADCLLVYRAQNKFESLTKDEKLAFENLRDGRPQTLFDVYKWNINVSGKPVIFNQNTYCDNDDHRTDSYWWKDLDTQEVGFSNQGARISFDQDKDLRDKFYFFLRHNEFPLQGLERNDPSFYLFVENQTLYYRELNGNKFEVTPLHQSENLQDTVKSGVVAKTEQPFDGTNLSELKNVQNVNAIALSNNYTKLTPNDKSQFDKLRKGFPSKFQKPKGVDGIVLNDAPVKIRNTTVTLNDINNKDPRPEAWWWTFVGPKTARIVENNQTRNLNKDEESKYLVFQDINQFPFRAFEDDGSLKNHGFTVDDNNLLTFTPRANSQSYNVVCQPKVLSMRENMLKLYECYYDGYAFPRWSVNFVMDDYDAYMKPTRVFYQQGSKREDVKTLVKEREPVNMTMDRRYDQAMFKQMFRWDTGAYSRLENPPNIAVYTLNRVRVPTNDADPTVYKEYDVHMIHAIGLAFDHESQPDYKKYMIGVEKSQRNAVVKGFYIRMFHMIFKACQFLGKKTLVWSLVGANNFAALYEDDQIKKGNTDQFISMWFHGWEFVSKKYRDINTDFIGHKYNGHDALWFPECIPRFIDEDHLYVNAWDCWSIVGNGNAMDNSLDGRVGSISTAAVSSWPLTNLHLDSDDAYVEIQDIPTDVC